MNATSFRLLVIDEAAVFPLLGRLPSLSGGADDGVDPLRALYALREARHSGRGGLLLIVRARVLRVATALEIAQQVVALESMGIQVTVFSEALNFPLLLSMASASRRIAPPLAGPLVLGLYLKDFRIGDIFDSLGVRIRQKSSAERKPQLFTLLPSGEETSQQASQATTLEQLSKAGLTYLRRFLRNDTLVYGEEYPTAFNAFSAGILTEVNYLPMLTAGMEGATRDLANQRGRRVLSRDPRVLLVSLSSPWGLSGESIESIEEGLLRALKRKVQGILFVIDINGGLLSEGDYCWNLVRRVPVPKIAFVLNAISTGYLVACGCDEIIASPLALIGGIGAIAYDIEPPLQRLSRVLISGHLTDNSEEDAKYRDTLAERASISHELLLERIRLSRGSQVSDRCRATEGIVVSSEVALADGMLDSIGHLDDAIDLMRTRFAGERIDINWYCAPSRTALGVGRAAWRHFRKLL